MTNIKIDPKEVSGSVPKRNLNIFAKAKKGYYLFGFISKLNKATDKDIENSTLYGIELVSKFHNIYLPIHLLDRSESGTITSKEYSYYALFGGLVLGILHISIRRYSPTRKQIVYTYKYKADGRKYNEEHGVKSEALQFNSKRKRQLTAKYESERNKVNRRD